GEDPIDFGKHAQYLTGKFCQGGTGPGSTSARRRSGAHWGRGSTTAMGGLQLAAKGEAARGEADRREATRGARVGRETARAADQDLLDRREGGQKWPRTVWIWSPELGRWKPEYGRPRQPVALTVSTDDVRRGEAFDYWRDIAYYHFDARRPPTESLGRFRAQAHGLITPGGDLFLYTSSEVAGQRTPVRFAPTAERLSILGWSSPACGCTGTNRKA